MFATAQSLQSEEQIIAELECLGVRYLSRQFETPPATPRTPHQLLRDIICQPSSRVRSALISLLLAHPEYAVYTFAAMALLEKEQARTYIFFYTAAVHPTTTISECLRVFGSTISIPCQTFFQANWAL